MKITAIHLPWLLAILIAPVSSFHQAARPFRKAPPSKVCYIQSPPKEPEQYDLPLPQDFIITTAVI